MRSLGPVRVFLAGNTFRLVLIFAGALLVLASAVGIAVGLVSMALNGMLPTWLSGFFTGAVIVWRASVCRWLTWTLGRGLGAPS